MRKITPIFGFILLLCLNAQAQLSGTKTIPGDYATITSAITALNAQGVGAGGVTFNIATGYTETISATLHITATGTAANPIIFQKDGSGLNPVITAYTGGTATPTSVTPDGIIALDGCDYVTFDGISLAENAANTTAALQMEYGFGLFKASGTDGCQNNIIKNCKITLDRLNNAAWTYGHNGSLGIAVHNTTSLAAGTGLTPTTASGTNSYNKFYNDTIQNCNAGISFNGFAAPSPFTLGDTNNDVGGTSAATGCIIKNFGGGTSATNPSNGIFAKDQWGLNCSYNKINSNDGGGVNHVNVLRGIYLNPSSTSASATVNNNTVTVKGGGTTQNISAIEVSFGSTAASNTININNNTILNCSYATATTGIFYGIYSTGSAANLNINSNVFTGCSTNATSANTYMIWNSGAVTTTINITNNSIAMSFPGSTAYLGTLYAIYNSSGTTGTTTSINNNSFTGCNFTTTGSGAIYFLYNTNSNANLSINGNDASGLTFNHSGAEYFIYNGSSTQIALNVNNNSFTNITRTGTAGTFYFYYAGSSSLGTSTQNFSGNIINGLTATTAGTGTLYLFYTADGSASPYPRKSFYNNTFKNINYNTTGTCYMSYINYLGDGSGASGSTIYNNIYDNITTSSSTFYGLYPGLTVSPTYSPSVYNNKISNITVNGAASTVYGAYVAAGAIGLAFYNNKLYNISATGATATTYGIYIVSANPYNIYNNYVGDLSATTSSKTAPAPSVAGIYLNNVGATINLSYNTVNVNTTGSGANFGTAALYAGTTPTLNLRNNILVNNSTANGTGKTIAYQRSTTTLTTHGSISNNNCFYAGTPSANNLIFYDGTNPDQTIADFKNRLLNREGASFSENPNYVSTTGTDATYLHISPSVATQLESGATPISGITTDYDGDTRNASNPDIGADEFSGIAIDLTSPSITYAALPKNTICATAKTITATITDATGVNTTAGTKPRLWYKKSTENDVLPVTNTSASNGWKYVETSSSSSPFSFTFDFSLLTSALNPGDSVTYFIAAQDINTTPNVGATIMTFTTSPTSVALSSGNFPTSGAANGFNIINQPSPLLIKSSKADACRKDKVTLDVDGVVVDGGEYQWQSSPNGTSGWTDIVGATTIPYTTDSVSATTYYRLLVKCGGTAISTSPSNTITFTINNPSPTTTTGASRCGTGTVTLNATSSSYTLNWYADATGGVALATGTSFTTPTISSTTTYYVGASTTGGAEFVGRLTPQAGAGTNLTTYGQDFTLTTGLTLNSVDVYSAGGTAITISLYNAGGVTQLFTTGSQTVTAGSGTTPTTINLGWALTPGTYRLMANGMTGNFIRENSTVTYPIALSTYGQINGFVSALTGSVTTSASYYFMYNWNVTGGCEGTRIPVTATITTAPSITVSSPNNIICTGSSSTLNVSSSNGGYAYTWTPGSSLTGASINVSPTTTTKYYVNANDAGTSCTNIDSITVTVQPTPTVSGLPQGFCVTGGSSVLSLSPSTGYAANTIQWQTSNNNTTFTDIAGANAVTYTTPSITATTYYKALIKNGLGVTCSEPSFTLALSNPTVATTTNGSRCGVGTVNLGATASSGATLNWYAAATGGSAIGTGTSFTTPSISSNTTYYVAASSTTGGAEFVGRLTPQAGAGTNLTTYGQDFTLTTALTLNSVNVYSAGGTAITISLYSAGGVTQLFTTGSQTVTAGSGTTPTTINLGWALTPGTYRLMANGMTGNFIRENSTVTYPIALSTYGQINGFVSALTGSVTTSASYYFMYNWNVTGGCEGTRIPVTATITTPPAITVSSPNNIICNGSSATLNVSSSNSGYSYTWTPGSSLTGSSINVSPTSTTKYYVNANDAGTSCTNMDSITVTVNPVPSAITITPSATTICNTSGQVATLVATGGTIVGTYTFGTGAAQNTATTYPSPYSVYYGGQRMQTLITAAELTAQGLQAGAINNISFNVSSMASNWGTTTTACQNFKMSIGNTSLTSLTAFQSGLTEVLAAGSYTPTVGYNNVHTFTTPFVWDGASNIIIETTFSNNIGGTVNDAVIMYNTTTSYQSTIVYRADNVTAAAAASATTVSLTYSARIDFKLNASVPTTFVWAPINGLFTDVAATTAYTGTNLTTVYAQPSATTLYTATSYTSVPCETSKTQNIVVDCSVPVTLVSFNGERRNGYNLLSWVTATENDNFGFELERSTDVLTFTTIATIASKATNGNSSIKVNYSYLDNNQLTINTYYRLKQIDKSGKITYSSIVLLKAGKITQIDIVAIYPNPVKNELNIKIASPINDKVELQLTDISGKVILAKQVTLVNGDNLFTIPVSQIAKGVYLIKTLCANGCESTVRKFVKE